jgi:hypothetical protein
MSASRMVADGIFVRSLPALRSSASMRSRMFLV